MSLWDGILIGSLIFGFVFLRWCANRKLRSIYKHASTLPNLRNISGHDAAKMIEEREAVEGLTLKRVAGEITDYYDPLKRVVHLSNQTSTGCSIASLAIAAHEMGHVVQHQTLYRPVFAAILVMVLSN